MVTRTRIGASSLAAVLLLTALAGCSGDDEDGPDVKNTDLAVEAEDAAFGSFVGEVSGTKAFVAVVATPAQGGKDAGAVQVYISDGRGVSEWFSGDLSDGGFVATSDDGDAEAEGQLSAGSATGTVVLPGGKKGSFEATPPSGGAGLYELSVSPSGELSGASAAGLAVKGEISLGKRGTGKLRLVDGKRLDIALVRKRGGELGHLRAGQVRLIVLSDGGLRGVAKARPANGGGFEFFIRSAQARMRG
ncbi:hypothetical protein DDE18_21085 [Nocardioides gansuensis]|uniref:Lipoprotein n=1 Tax=Nocardioides gansuensis TaxID=2138300 RepID=A0A2T8F5A7_9ACTN|nr:hypothetical protein [Nocardioides gansuensis]PVG80879.1 hypothetical protein DDE18_21085 [Nocardioides gansuensis]